MTEISARCPRCKDGQPYTSPGTLAGHLVGVHGISASVALVEARKCFPRPAAAAPLQTPPPPAAPQEETSMRKRKVNKCSKCQQPGHKATTCPKGTKTPAPTGQRGRPSSRAAASPASASVPVVAPDIIANAREKATSVVRQKIQEELAWAEAYVAELRRIAGLA